MRRTPRAAGMSHQDAEAVRRHTTETAAMESPVPPSKPTPKRTLTGEYRKDGLFRILSLDGGGAKGFYTLGVLKEIEGTLKCPQLCPSIESELPGHAEVLCNRLSPLLSRTREIGHPFEEPGEHVRVLVAEEPLRRCGPVAALHQVVVDHGQCLQPPSTHPTVSVLLQRQPTVASFHARTRPLKQASAR